jgi:hypothetical protein
MTNKKTISTTARTLLTLSVVMMVGVIGGCSSAAGPGVSPDSGNPTVSQGEHGPGGEGGGEGGSEESGNALTLNESYDTVRKGARLIMVYDAQSNSFVGTVENTTSSTLRQVRVEVHLSNGIELGPTTPVDLAAGEKVDVTLPATAQAFDGWTPHAEVGTGTGGEHGSGGEGGEGGGEHGGGGESGD